MASQGGRPPTSSSDPEGQRTIPGIHRDEDPFTLYLRRRGNLATNAADIQTQFQANPSTPEPQDGNVVDGQDGVGSDPRSSLEANPASSPIAPTSPVDARVNGHRRAPNGNSVIVPHIGAAFEDMERENEIRRNGMQASHRSRDTEQVNGIRNPPTAEGSGPASGEGRNGRRNGGQN